MFREGLPPVLDPEYAGEKGNKTMESNVEVIGSKDEEKELDVGDLQMGNITAEEFVDKVLKREGGDPKRVEAATRMLQFSWLAPLSEKRMSADDFSKGVYESIAKVLKRQGPAEKSEKEIEQEERIKRAIGRRAA